MAKNFEKLIFGGLHEKHAVQRGIWVPTPLLSVIETAPYNLCADRTENTDLPTRFNNNKKM
jgi:hypothetical protein